MKKLRTKLFEEWDYTGHGDGSYKKQIEEIVNQIKKKGYECKYLRITDDSCSFSLNTFPFSIHVIDDDATIIVEDVEDHTTNNLGIYDINTEIDKIVEVITEFEYGTFE